LDGVIDAHGKLDYAASEVYIPNEYVAAQARRNHNLYFGASINPHRSDALAQLEQAAQSGAVLVKWIPSIMGIDPAQERLRPFYESLQRLGLPLLTHTGEERSFSSAQDQLADPLRLELPLRLGVTVIAAHCGSGGSIEGQRHLDRLQQMMRRYPNLWADISSLTQINRLGYLKEVLAAPEFRDRLLFGSDFPLINTPLVSAWYFPLQLSLRQIWGISRLDSPWDRDLQMKQNLGVPAAVFSAANRLLRLQAGKK
jgi:predicted TIM-barrel fold metal-dependent hydrolase